MIIVVVVWSLISHVWLFATAWTAALQAYLSSTISQSLLKFMSIELVMLANHLILCHPLLLLPSVFPSIRVRVFSKKQGLCIRWPKYWSFSISSSNEYSRLISFRIDWLVIIAIYKIHKIDMNWYTQIYLKPCQRGLKWWLPKNNGQDHSASAIASCKLLLLTILTTLNARNNIKYIHIVTWLCTYVHNFLI